MFRSAFGISFVEYLTMLRLREAILLLRSGKKSVTECAMESGFGSMRSFYRAFSEEFGVTPKEYLKQLNVK
jgi:AraC-like DNA-binding protein